MARRIEIADTTKYIIAFMVASVIGYCTITDIYIDKELWTISGVIFTYIFMNSAPKAMEMLSRGHKNAWVRSMLAILLIGVVCFCSITKREIGKEFWSLIGGVMTFIFNSKQSD